MSGTSEAQHDLEDTRLGQGIFFVVLARIHRDRNFLVEEVSALSGRNFSCHPHEAQ